MNFLQFYNELVILISSETPINRDFEQKIINSKEKKFKMKSTKIIDNLSKFALRESNVICTVGISSTVFFLIVLTFVLLAI